MRMSRPFLAVVLSLCLSWSAAAGDQVVSSEAVTTSAAASASHGRAQAGHVVITAATEAYGKLPETTTDQLISDAAVGRLTSESSAALHFDTLTTVAGTTAGAAVSPLKMTDTIEFRVLVGLSCKWMDGDGVERRSKVCPLQSTCNLGPITIVKKSGLDQRLYFCTGEQQSLVSIACRLEDSDRVIVLPRCMTGSTCSIGPLALSYGGRQVQGYFCDALQPRSSSGAHLEATEAAADTWTASGRSQLLGHRQREEEEPRRRSGNLPTFSGRGKTGNDDDRPTDDKSKNWTQDGKDKGRDGGSRDDDYVHYGRQNRGGGRRSYATTDHALEEAMTTNETPIYNAETSDQNRLSATTVSPPVA